MDWSRSEDDSEVKSSSKDHTAARILHQNYCLRRSQGWICGIRATVLGLPGGVGVGS